MLIYARKMRVTIDPILRYIEQTAILFLNQDIQRGSSLFQKMNKQNLLRYSNSSGENV